MRIIGNDAYDEPREHRLSGSGEIDAIVARTAPAVLDLLSDGVPRSRVAIVAALAGRHARGDVARTLMRLAVTGRIVEVGRRYAAALTPHGQEAD